MQIFRSDRRSTRLRVGLCGLLLGSLTAAALVGCAKPEASTGAEPSASAVTTTAPPRTVDTYHLALGPADPELGHVYAFDLYVDCSGGIYTVFGGMHLKTAAPPPVGPPTANSAGVVTVTGYLAGWMTKQSPDTAVFALAGSTTTATYHITQDQIPVCS